MKTVYVWFEYLWIRGYEEAFLYTTTSVPTGSDLYAFVLNFLKLLFISDPYFHSTYLNQSWLEGTVLVALTLFTVTLTRV